jgi:hypothetical protein
MKTYLIIGCYFIREFDLLECCCNKRINTYLFSGISGALKSRRVILLNNSDEQQTVTLQEAIFLAQETEHFQLHNPT